ncbi:dTDP-4-dehydrorhamnose reductase [Cereibacter sphaeroides]|uniref:dTDP-4-dehydrorhamnose reductase n=3 Tax=Cereibacter sphaeroides TaxID=1063 RepID=UPI001F26ED73|nr:dTDP-4-dehydrorhamnose reductase [Cereibacter sphaeroides]MCE6958641.1 dTDP-4-dehydrorhamnose reductase [Cereibacter sphaeroides]MCE6973476.1 dTDP-4-dehydrorhamnose reductase [Cereibacter sphaeroides]
MILVFGRTGQVACELARLAPEARFLGRDEADLTDPAACARAIREAQPSAVINAAAWTAVDRAEDEEAGATVVNGEAPGAMARACAELGIPFVQISTDYVFDGSGDRPWRPGDPVGPLGAYGRSKLAGEEATRAAGGTHAILRTSWVFSAHGANFVKTMLRLGAARDRLTVVMDQVGGPTPAADIASACLAIAGALGSKPGLSGTYHLSGAPDVSWAGFAREIFRQAGLSCEVQDIPSADYPQRAHRPANSRLDCSDLSRFGLARPDWRQGLARVLSDLQEISE